MVRRSTRPVQRLVEGASERGSDTKSRQRAQGMSSNAPAIPFFGDAYLADTRHLSLEEHGAYLQLMMIAWRIEGCCLPDDDARLARMLGITAKKWAKLKPTVMGFWTLYDGRWSQKRLTKERRFVAKKSEQNAEAANARWSAKSLKTNEPSNANASPMQSERNAPPPPPNIKKETTNVVSGKTRGSRLPSVWQPLPLPFDCQTIVDRWQPGVIERELSKFKDYWPAQPGQRGVKVDWDATWRNWIRTADGRQVNGKQPDNDGLGRTGRAVVAVRDRIRAAGIQ